tara:strand:+ start:454 stop:1143 length:690 start_codon:yes stop_codon:yes gene_type:complete
MILMKIKKKNTLFSLILILFAIINTKTFASNKDIQNKLIFDNQKIIYNKELINKIKTKELIKKLNFHISYYKRKITIRKDYLKLINIFPSNKNIKSADINKEIEKFKNTLNEYHIKMNNLQNLYKFLTSDEYFDIYIVNYNLKIFNDQKSDFGVLEWFSFCSLNPIYEKEMILIRQNLFDVFHFLGYGSYPSNINSNKYRNYLESPDSKLHNKVCNEFKKKYLFRNKNT